MTRVCLIVALALSSPVMAAEHENIDTDPAHFPARKAHIEQALREGKRYADLGVTRQREVQEALDRMQGALAGVKTIDELPQDERLALLNDQSLVNTVLAKAAEDSRLVCKRERRVGSQRIETSCRTAGEIRRARAQAKRQLEHAEKRRGDSEFQPSSLPGS